MNGADLDDLTRRLSPVRWILLAVAVVCAVVAFAIVANGLGFRWDPFNLAERRADRAEAAAAAATSNSGARTVEAAGAQDTTRLVERAAGDRAAATEIVHRYAIQLEAPAHDPIPVPDDGADLRAVFGELCQLRPAVCADPGHSAATRSTGDGPAILPDPAAAR